MAYATTSDFHQYQVIDDTDTADDALISDLLDKATGIFEMESRRVFACDTDSTRRFNALEDVEWPWLYLDADLCAITSIDPGTGTTVYASDIASSDGQDGVMWYTDPANVTPIHAIKLSIQSGIFWTFRLDPEDAIAVTGRWAYSTTPPIEVKHSVIRLAQWLYFQRMAGADADRPIIAPDGSVIMPSEFARDAMQVAMRYRRTKMGSV